MLGAFSRQIETLSRDHNTLMCKSFISWNGNTELN